MLVAPNITCYNCLKNITKLCFSAFYFLVSVIILIFRLFYLDDFTKVIHLISNNMKKFSVCIGNSEKHMSEMSKFIGIHFDIFDKQT